MRERGIDELYRTHGPSVLRRARAILGSDAEALDAVQEIFLDLLARPAQLDGVVKRMAWLYRKTIFHCLKQIRDRGGHARILRALPRPDRDAPRAEQLTTVRDLLARLPGRLAEVAVYYYVDEMTHAEIAGILGCSRRHVGDLLQNLQRRSEDDALSFAK
jgi:RNA polymerase sigma factor (sigma-70 family)